MPQRTELTALILAGGQGRRMNGHDKGLIEFEQRPMIAHVIDGLHGQAAHIIISANRNLDRYRAFGFEVVSDSYGDYSGPLAGIASSLSRCPSRYLLTLPCDTPRVHPQLSPRLAKTMEDHHKPLVIAHDGRRLQTLFMLMDLEHPGLRESLVQFVQNGQRKVRDWIARQAYAIASFSDQPEAFININAPEDLLRAQSLNQA